jgi:hypothetical protein
MALTFIFMLTHNDRTVADARDRLEDVLAGGCRHIGFKDVGLPFDELARLSHDIKSAGATAYLEVVSLNRESELTSAKAALGFEVDYLLGGTRAADVAPLLHGTPVKYFPFPGRIVGHPSVLEGEAAEIAASARGLAARDDVHGLDLLAYRYAGDVPSMMKQVCEAAGKPVIMAGSIDGEERIADVGAAGAMGFTVGTAAFDNRFPAASPGLRGQVEAIDALAGKYGGDIL